jgi:hypothetical protein
MVKLPAPSPGISFALSILRIGHQLRHPRSSSRNGVLPDCRPHIRFTRRVRTAWRNSERHRTQHGTWTCLRGFGLAVTASCSKQSPKVDNRSGDLIPRGWTRNTSTSALPTAFRMVGRPRRRHWRRSGVVACSQATMESYSVRELTLSAAGKSAGTFCVTLPVAAHSVPLWNVVINPTQLSAGISWPMVV